MSDKEQLIFKEGFFYGLIWGIIVVLMMVMLLGIFFPGVVFDARGYAQGVCEGQVFKSFEYDSWSNIVFKGVLPPILEPTMTFNKGDKSWIRK